jgi:hypothetical protein
MWEIYQNVYLGSKKDAQCAYTLQEYGITHVLNATADIKNYFENLQSVECKYLIKQSEEEEEEEEDSIVQTDETLVNHSSNLIFDKEDGEDDEDDEDDENDEEEEVDELFSKDPVDTEQIISSQSTLNNAPDSTQSNNNNTVPEQNDAMETDGTEEPVTPSTPSTPSTPTGRRKPQYGLETVDFVQEMKYMRVAVADSMEVDLSKFFIGAVEFIEQSLQQSTDGAAKCLVHCREGKSRSVSILIVYGMKVLNMTLKEAVENVTKKSHGRPRINDGFKRQLMEFELQLLNERQQLNLSDAETAAIENTLDFFSARRDRKRARASYCPTDDLDDGDDDYVEPARKKRKKSNKKKQQKKKTALQPVTASILSYFAPLQPGKQPKKQVTLFQMFKKETPAAPEAVVPKDEPVKLSESTENSKIPSEAPVIESVKEPSKDVTADPISTVNSSTDLPVSEDSVLKSSDGNDNTLNGKKKSSTKKKASTNSKKKSTKKSSKDKESKLVKSSGIKKQKKTQSAKKSTSTKKTTTTVKKTSDAPVQKTESVAKSETKSKSAPKKIDFSKPPAVVMTTKQSDEVKSDTAAKKKPEEKKVKKQTEVKKSVAPKKAKKQPEEKKKKPEKKEDKKPSSTAAKKKNVEPAKDIRSFFTAKAQ